MMLECLLLTTSAILPAKPAAKSNKAPNILTIALAEVATADGFSTRAMIKAGYWEADPVGRAFIGRYPTWKRMAPFGAVEVVGSAWLARKMRNSERFHKVWWIPQAVLIGAHAYGTANNIRLARAKR